MPNCASVFYCRCTDGQIRLVRQGVGRMDKVMERNNQGGRLAVVLRKRLWNDWLFSVFFVFFAIFGFCNIVG